MTLYTESLNGGLGFTGAAVKGVNAELNSTLSFGGFKQVVCNAGINGSTNVTSITGSITNQTAVANTLIGVVKNSGGASPTSITDTKGNTWVQDTAYSGGGPHVTIIRTILTTALGTGDTVTVSWSASSNSEDLLICEYFGSYTPDVSAGAYSATVTAASTSYPSELIVSGVGGGGGADSGTFSVTSSNPALTIRVQAAAQSVTGAEVSAMADSFADSGIITPTATWAASNEPSLATAIVAYKFTTSTITNLTKTTAVSLPAATLSFVGSFLRGMGKKFTANLWSGDRQGLLFDGIQNYMTSTTQQTNPQTFSLAIWFRTTTTNGGRIIGFGNDQTGQSGDYDRHIWVANNGTINFGCFTGTSTVVVTSTSAYNDGKWHLAVATIGTGGMSLYVDTASAVTNANTVSQTYNGYWRLAYDDVGNWGSNTPTDYYFCGELSNAHVYSRVLSSSEVSGLFTGTEPSTSGLVSWWLLNGNVNDSSGNNNTGILEGSPKPVYIGSSTPALTKAISYPIASQVGFSRINLIPNPSFEGTGFWAGSNYNGSYTHTINASNYALYGNYSGGVTGNTAAGGGYWTGDVATTVGQTYTISAYVYLANWTSGTVYLAASNTSQSDQYASSSAFGSANTWVRGSMTFTARYSTTRIILDRPSGTTDMYWDGVLLEANGNLGSYFDGSITGAVWNGTANASTSTYYLTTFSKTVGKSPFTAALAWNPPRGLEFDGWQNYLTFNGSTANITASSSWSFITTFQCFGPSSAKAGQAIIDLMMNYSGATGFELQINTPTPTLVVYGMKASAGVSSAGSIQYGQVQYAGITWDGTTLRFYINGSLDANTYTNVASVAGSGTGGYIGNEGVTTDFREFHGVISDVRAYAGRVLTGTDMANYAAGTMPTTTNMVLGYTFSEGSGNATADISGNGATATLQGTPKPIWIAGGSPLTKLIGVALSAGLGFVGSFARLIAGKNIVFLVDGTPAIKLPGNSRLYIRLLDGRSAIRVGKNLYMPL